MNLYIRLLRVLLGGWIQASTHYADSTATRFRVWLHDLDAFGHMNNGRYLQIMDVARTHWMVRSGVFDAIRRNRWAPLLGGGFIRYRFSLKILQPYHVHTRLLCWDDRWFFLEHLFADHENRHIAVGITRAALRQDGSWVPSADVVAQVHDGAVSPRMPRYVREWMALEDKMYRRGSRYHRETSKQAPLREVS